MANKIRWLTYDLGVYGPPDQTNWRSVGGIYVFAGRNVNRRWVAYYIGETGDFSERMPGHERWTEAARLGATHVHAVTIPLQANRDRAESALIETYQPPLNTQLR